MNYEPVFAKTFVGLPMPNKPVPGSEPAGATWSWRLATRSWLELKFEQDCMLSGWVATTCLVRRETWSVAEVGADLEVPIEGGADLEDPGEG